MKTTLQNIPEEWVIVKEVRDLREAMELARKRLSKSLAYCYTSLIHNGDGELVGVKTTYLGKELSKAVRDA